ncbi:MAG: class I SAM-dependent methyltransferase [Syntrophaceae bacterium]
MKKDELDQQQLHWDRAYTAEMDFFGDEPSLAARRAAERFLEAGCSLLLELGAGQGRDTLYLASLGFSVYALEYSESGLWGIIDKGVKTDLGEMITPVFHDLRKPLPFQDASLDGCFSHMLYCMAFSRAELEFLNGEICRVLKPGGLNIYTVRHKGDAHYGKGTHIGEDLYEFNGFIVHYFDRAMVDHLAEGFELLDVEEFEEGSLPRKLFQVTLRKK